MNYHYQLGIEGRARIMVPFSRSSSHARFYANTTEVSWEEREIAYDVEFEYTPRTASGRKRNPGNEVGLNRKVTL